MELDVKTKPFRKLLAPVSIEATYVGPDSLKLHTGIENKCLGGLLREGCTESMGFFFRNATDGYEENDESSRARRTPRKCS